MEYDLSWKIQAFQIKTWYFGQSFSFSVEILTL